MDLVAMLPWWAGVALAVISYVILHRLAAPPQLAMTSPNQIGDVVRSALVSGLANAGQIILPILCLVGAVISFARRRQRQGLISTTTNSRSVDALTHMSWREFELLVGEAFRMQGYAVTEQGGGGADGGVDLVLRKGKEKFLVQCKQWKAYKVGVDVVRQLYGVMAAQGAAGGFVITSGSFTADAQAFAEGRNVKLVDGPKLFGLIQQAKGATSGAAPTAGRQARSYTPPPVASEPLCPTCQASMVRRTAKKGANAGSQFWGCSQYPECRGTR